MPVTKNILDNKNETTTTQIVETKNEPDWSVAARTITFDATSGIHGDWDESDVRIPTLRIARGSGAAVSEHTQSTLLLGDDEILAPPNLKNPDPDAVIRWVPYYLSKRWREDLNRDDIAAGQRPMIFDTKDEVEEQGGTTNKYEAQASGKRLYKRCADIKMLVEKPEGLKSGAFNLELDGKQYACATYYARGTDFWGMATDMFNSVGALTKTIKDAKGKPVLNDNGKPVRQTKLSRYFWTMHVISKMVGEYAVLTPDVKRTWDEPGKEVDAFLADLMGA